MDFKKGFKIKPDKIEADGGVLFTDGTNVDIVPNQQACEAYGYKYDIRTGSCIAFKNTNIDSQFSNLTNKKQGEKNTFGNNTHNTNIIGRENKTLGENENCLISGTNNTINSTVNDATVLGGFGRALRYGEFVVGGGANGGRNTDNVPQFSVVQLSQNTTDNTATDLLVNGQANQ